MESTTKINAEAFTFLPDDLLTNIRVTKPLGIITVRGTVINLRPYIPEGKNEPVWVYGTITGVDASMEFKCHPEAAPSSVGESVIIQGTLDTKTAYNGSGLDVIISGNVTGKWNPHSGSGYIHLEKTNGRIYLLDFLKRHELKSLKIITTQVGHNDLLSAFNKKMSDKDIHMNTEICRFDSASTLLKAAEAAAKDSTVKAIAFVRGGKGDKTIEIWNNSEFVAKLLSLNIRYYTAIGHTDPIYLAEKYSDEALNNPNDFGFALSEALSRIKTEKFLRKQNNIYKESLSRKDLKIEKLSEEYKKEKEEIESRHRAEKLRRNKLAFIFIIFALIIFEVFFRPYMGDIAKIFHQ